MSKYEWEKRKGRSGGCGAAGEWMWGVAWALCWAGFCCCYCCCCGCAANANRLIDGAKWFIYVNACNNSGHNNNNNSEPNLSSLSTWDLPHTPSCLAAPFSFVIANDLSVSPATFVVVRDLKHLLLLLLLPQLLLLLWQRQCWRLINLLRAWAASCRAR